MQDYKKVIKERYDKQQYGDWKCIKNDVYSLINPVGFYGEFKMAQILKEFVLMVDSRKDSLDKIKLCDLGCGGGDKTRFMAELLGNPNQIYGIEYSKNRLQHCKDMNPFIHYEYMDLTNDVCVGGGIPFNTQFDGITAFVVFMHFSRKYEIINALKNIYHALKPKGIFLWYEANARSHWDGKRKNVDHWGFSTSEMDKYATNVGFRLFKKFGVYTQIPIINIPTIYLAKNIKNIWILELVEKLPFRKNNNIRIYCKE